MKSKLSSLTALIHTTLEGPDTSDQLRHQLERILAATTVVALASGLTQNTLLFAEKSALGGFITNQFTLFSIVPHSLWWLVFFDCLGLLAALSVLIPHPKTPRYMVQWGFGIGFLTLLSKLLLIPGYLGFAGVVACCGMGLLSLTPLLSSANTIKTLRSFAGLGLLTNALLLLTNPRWMEGLAVIGTRLTSPLMAQLAALLSLLSFALLHEKLQRLAPLVAAVLGTYFLLIGQGFSALGIVGLVLLLAPAFASTKQR